MATCDNCRHDNRSGATRCAKCGKLLPGTVLQTRYQVRSVLSGGGQGAIYLAQALRFGNDQCIVKELRESFADPSERQSAIQMFQSEANMLQRLNHQQIPKVMDRFEEHGKQYIVMAYVQGETLDAVLQREGSPGLPEEHVLGWVDQICEVLEYLHSQNPPVIFRDLKPSNVMLGPDGHIGLIDFGISRFFKPGQTSDTWNLGTAGYAPPEQFGKGQTDVRSDVYALGAMAHQLLTGRDPSITLFQFPPLRKVNSSISGDIEAVIGKALALDPANRYQSIREMREALNNAHGIFEIRVDFVHPQMYMAEDVLSQFKVEIASKDTTHSDSGALTVHIGMVLDVSVSMNDPEKYPQLLNAVKYLIQELPEHYSLTVGLFSRREDIVVSLRPVGECQRDVDKVIESIDQSVAKFGDQTLLAPALSQVVERVQWLHRPNAVHRICILTDGQIHDGRACAHVFDQIRRLGAEVYAYGFGSDWNLEPLQSLVQPCRVGSFKPVATDASRRINSYDITNTFGRFAQAGRYIIAADAQLAVSFLPNVVLGDVFRYQPTARYLGTNGYDNKRTFRGELGSLEEGISYIHCFEERLQPTQESIHPIGMIELSYIFQGQRRVQRRPIVVERTADKRRAEQMVVQDVREAFLILESLRTSDPQKLLLSLRARLDHLSMINGDPRQIDAIQNAIWHVQATGTMDGLTEEQTVLVHSDSRGGTVQIAPR